MTLREYIERLNRFAMEHPESLDYKAFAPPDQCGYFIDELDPPSFGYDNGHEFQPFPSQDTPKALEVNAVCIC